MPVEYAIADGRQYWTLGRLACADLITLSAIDHC